MIESARIQQDLQQDLQQDVPVAMYFGDMMGYENIMGISRNDIPKKSPLMPSDAHWAKA